MWRSRSAGSRKADRLAAWLDGSAVGSDAVAGPGDGRCGAAPGGGDNDPVHLITPRADWTLLVPLKSSVRGKSRIDVDPGLRGRLAFAMAADTISAASAAPGVGLVLVVAEDARGR